MVVQQLDQIDYELKPASISHAIPPFKMSSELFINPPRRLATPGIGWSSRAKTRERESFQSTANQKSFFKKIASNTTNHCVTTELPCDQ
jgi:hypothetical protein